MTAVVGVGMDGWASRQSTVELPCFDLCVLSGQLDLLARLGKVEECCWRMISHLISVEAKVMSIMVF